MQTLIFNTTKREVKVVNPQEEIIFSEKNVPTVKVMDQHYEVYAKYIPFLSLVYYNQCDMDTKCVK